MPIYRIGAVSDGGTQTGSYEDRVKVIKRRNKNIIRQIIFQLFNNYHINTIQQYYYKIQQDTIVMLVKYKDTIDRLVVYFLIPGTGGRTYFDNSCLVCLVSVHKPVVRDRLKFKNWPVKRSKRASLARFQRDWAILVLLVSYEKKKNVLARLKRDETSEIRRSDGQTMFDRRCLVDRV